MSELRERVDTLPDDRPERDARKMAPRSVPSSGMGGLIGKIIALGSRLGRGSGPRLR